MWLTGQMIRDNMCQTTLLTTVKHSVNHFVVKQHGLVCHLNGANVLMQANLWPMLIQY